MNKKQAKLIFTKLKFKTPFYKRQSVNTCYLTNQITFFYIIKKNKNYHHTKQKLHNTR